MNPITYLRKPEYLLRPTQAWKRLQRCWKRARIQETVVLPWGASLKVYTTERIGFDLYLYGIFDKIVPEAITRLLDRGEFAIEVGANIGQNCSLMAVKVGPAGQVLAFEPHPEIFRELEENAATWSGLPLGRLRFENVALGDDPGDAWLTDGAEFNHNRGSAALQSVAAPHERTFKVRVRRLDDYLADVPQVGVCKIDVEGHELQVFKGAEEALRRGLMRDIIFEDFNPQPGAVAQFLSGHGFHLFQLLEQWLKPVLVPLAQARLKSRGFSYNYLATREPDRALARFRAPGWFCLLNL